MAKISVDQLQKQSAVQRIPQSADPREMIAAKKIHDGMNPAKAVAEAGFRFSTQAKAQEFGERIRDKFNARVISAYEHVGLTPEFIALKHKEMIDSDDVKPGDKLKAIDQVLNVVGGYAPKQVDVTTVSFEQTVIEIANKVDLTKLTARDVRGLLAGTTDTTEVVDAEIVGQS